MSGRREALKTARHEVLAPDGVGYAVRAVRVVRPRDAPGLDLALEVFGSQVGPVAEPTRLLTIRLGWGVKVFRPRGLLLPAHLVYGEECQTLEQAVTRAADIARQLAKTPRTASGAALTNSPAASADD